jgi:branched-chain amino acid transport system permease protein
MSLLAIQFFNGLSHATTLFLMAAGLTLIFGVTRIVNFAHGSFYMLGAMLSAHLVTNWWPALADTAWGYAFRSCLCSHLGGCG